MIRHGELAQHIWKDSTLKYLYEKYHPLLIISVIMQQISLTEQYKRKSNVQFLFPQLSLESKNNQFPITCSFCVLTLFKKNVQVFCKGIIGLKKQRSRNNFKLIYLNCQAVKAMNCKRFQICIKMVPLNLVTIKHEKFAIFHLLCQ